MKNKFISLDISKEQKDNFALVSNLIHKDLSINPSNRTICFDMRYFNNSQFLHNKNLFCDEVLGTTREQRLKIPSFHRRKIGCLASYFLIITKSTTCEDWISFINTHIANIDKNPDLIHFLFSNGWYHIDNSLSGAHKRLRYVMMNNVVPENSFKELGDYLNYSHKIVTKFFK